MSTLSRAHIEQALATYTATMTQLRAQGARTESALRRAFAGLLNELGKAKKWTLVEEYSQKLSSHTIYYDGVLCDQFRLPHAYWEAKDSHDDLDKEIQLKRQRGYSFGNMLFEDTQTLVLFQNGLEVGRARFTDSSAAARLLEAFINYEVAPFTRFEEAIAYFGQEIPTLANGLASRIAYAHAHNQSFQRAHADFMEICRQALNPNISQAAVDEMLIQHMLTERLMRKLFDEDFVQHNVIALFSENMIDRSLYNQFQQYQPLL